MTDTMLETRPDTGLDGRLPGAAQPYVIRYGQGVRHNAAGQIVYTLAGDAETGGGFAALLAELPYDQRAIPLHYHEREHDTWFCLRGKLQVWCNDQSRVMTPGDFAYVKPRDIHSYRSLAPRSSFFGIVAPGGWEQFFVDAGEVWGMVALPPPGHPFDFRRMGPAMAKNDVHPVPDATYGEASAMGEGDQALPGGYDSYFLEAGFGDRHLLHGHLATAVMTVRQNDGTGDIRMIEGAGGMAMPTVSHATTTTFLFVLSGAVAVTLNGEEQVLTAGDGANIPPGTRYSTRIVSGMARWLACSAGGNGGEMWAQGSATDLHCFPGHCDDGDAARLGAMTGVDATVHS